MKKSNLSYLFCAISLFGLSYIQTNPKNSKGKTVIQIGEKLDLKDFKKTDDGLLYKTITAGTGARPYSGETVTVHYTGWLLIDKDKVGDKFDSSVDRGQHFKFKLGQGMVIRGWDISLADMKIGEKRLVILPPHLAYGSHGAGNVIKPNSTLIFEIELFDAA